MSLVAPTFFDVVKKYRTLIVVGALALLLVAAALGLYSCGEEYFFRSKIQKDKDAIKTDLDKIANANAVIAEQEREKAAATANVNAWTEELNKNIFGRDELKKESNQALANVQKAINANTNIDRTIEDAKRVLDKLDQLDNQ